MFLTMDTSALHRAVKQAHPSANHEIVRSNHPPRQIIHRLYHLPSFGAPASPDGSRNFILSNSLWRDGDLRAEFRKPFNLIAEITGALPPPSGDGTPDSGSMSSLVGPAGLEPVTRPLWMSVSTFRLPKAASPLPAPSGRQPVCLPCPPTLGPGCVRTCAIGAPIACVAIPARIWRIGAAKFRESSPGGGGSNEWRGGVLYQPSVCLL
jgi:hypothetical protein